jgi:hypothetical protein
MPQTDPEMSTRRLFDAGTLAFATFFFSVRFERPCYLYWTLCRSFCGGAYLGRAAKIGVRRCWGVVQLVGHLTVNEAGEGSNPSAPAIFPFRKFSSEFLWPLQIALVSPPRNAQFPTIEADGWTCKR